MSLFQSHQKLTFTEVEALKEDFRRLSEKLDDHLPWIIFARNSGAALLMTGAVYMLAAETTLCPSGRGAAILPMLAGLVLHVLTVIYREVTIIRQAKRLSGRLMNIVLENMNTSAMAMVGYDWLLAFTLPLNCFSFVSSIMAETDDVSAFRILTHATAFIFNLIFVYNIVTEKDDINFKGMCQASMKILDTLLGVSTVQSKILSGKKHQ